MSFTEQIPLKGHLKIERLDKNNNVIDTPIDEHNLICSNARISMAEIFANLNDIKFAHRFMLGTQGHKENNVYLPKDSTDGFVKERDRMFSQPSTDIWSNGDMIETLLKNDILTISSPSGVNEYWRYNGENQTNYILDYNTVTQQWTKFDTLPYTVTIDFTLPRDNNVPEDQTNTEEGSPYSVQVIQHDTSVSFIVTVPMEQGNDQYINDPNFGTPTSLFTEASLWVNDRIFSLKTFQALTKDDSIKLRATWTIIF